MKCLVERRLRVVNGSRNLPRIQGALEPQVLCAMEYEKSVRNRE